MTNKAFRELVRRMRAAQKDYFRTRQKSYLDYSRGLERQVDQALEEFGDEATLFEAARPGDPFKPTQAHIDTLRHLAEGTRLEPYEWELVEDLWRGLRNL